jgi:hypothetical protein
MTDWNKLASIVIFCPGTTRSPRRVSADRELIRTYASAVQSWDGRAQSGFQRRPLRLTKVIAESLNGEKCRA